MKNSESKNVLFLALSGIGNLVMWLPTIAALKKTHPNWHVTVWVAPRGTAALAQAQPYIDEVIEMPISVSPPARGGARGSGRFAMHLKNIIALRKHHFDAAIVLSPGNLLKSAATLFFAGIPVRIGTTYPLGRNPHSSFLLTNAVPEDPSLHDIEQNLRLLEPLDIHPDPVENYSLQIPEENKREADMLCNSYKLKANSSVGIHAGSAEKFIWKRWPIERFAEVAHAIIQKNPDTKILLFGGKDELEQNKKLEQLINVKFPNTAISISASLMTTAALIQQCKFLISNDSGLMHIAAAVGVKVIALFGPTNEAQTGPRGKNSVVVCAPGTQPIYHTESGSSLGNTPHESMLAITPQIVIDKASNLL